MQLPAKSAGFTVTEGLYRCRDSRTITCDLSLRASANPPEYAVRWGNGHTWMFNCGVVSALCYMEWCLNYAMVE